MLHRVEDEVVQNVLEELSIPDHTDSFSRGVFGYDRQLQTLLLDQFLEQRSYLLELLKRDVGAQRELEIFMLDGLEGQQTPVQELHHRG